MKLRPLPIALAALALSPASALAAPRWSAPAQVIGGAGADLTASPQAFVSPAGRSLVIAGSGSQALLAGGNAAGVFDSAKPVATTAGGSIGLGSAIGADGTVAIAWASDGAGHVTVITPDGTVLPQADLPGSGVNAIGAGVSADGGVIVAYRTKESTNSYSLRVTTAPAGSSSFGDPVAIETTAAADSIDVATGPGGAAAIAYRKLAGKYRTHVAVRPAGAGAFEAPQAMPAIGDQSDYSPQVAFDADGTLVAAWGNPAGAQYALRGPGAAAFGSAVALGAGSAYAVDLEPTPQGGTAVAVSGDGAVRAALQSAPGGSFSDPTPVGPTYKSQFSNGASVTTTPAGTVTVVTTNPVDGAVHAADAGGEDTVIGYGRKETVTPVAVASSADRTVAAWTAESGVIMAATRSESANPATPTTLGPKPTGLDTKGPRLRYLGRSRRIRVSGKTMSISFKVRCDEACALLVTGSMRIPATAKTRKRIDPLPPLRTTKAKAGTQTVTIKLGARGQKDLHAAVRKGRGAQMFLVLEARDARANATRTRLQLTLKPTTKSHRR